MHFQAGFNRRHELANSPNGSAKKCLEYRKQFRGLKGIIRSKGWWSGEMFLLLTSSSQWRRQWLNFDMKWPLGVLSYHIGLHWLVEMKSFEMRDALNAWLWAEIEEYICIEERNLPIFVTSLSDERDIANWPRSESISVVALAPRIDVQHMACLSLFRQTNRSMSNFTICTEYVRGTPYIDSD